MSVTAVDLNLRCAHPGLAWDVYPRVGRQIDPDQRCLTAAYGALRPTCRLWCAVSAR